MVGGTAADSTGGGECKNGGGDNAKSCGNYYNTGVNDTDLVHGIPGLPNSRDRVFRLFFPFPLGVLLFARNYNVILDEYPFVFSIGISKLMGVSSTSRNSRRDLCPFLFIL